jgi:glutaminyl-peptide cyclotransferase
MKQVTIILLYTFLPIFVMLNCAQSSKNVRPPVTSLNLTTKGHYHTGNKISLSIKTKIKEGTFRNTELFLDGKSITKSDKPEFIYDIQTSNLNVGTHILKAIASTNEGITGENFSEFLLLSDLIPEKYNFKTIKVYPHNVEHFTEGLEIKNGFLYEGTGQEGSSAIYKIDLSTAKIIKEVKLDPQYFGEGITILNGKLYQLTYKSQIGFVRDAESFELLKTWNYRNEQGWGLTNDGKSLIMSDGSEYIYYIDPETFKEIKKIEVCNNFGVVKNLNELEFINGQIWANLWTTDTIVKIDPETGKIIAEIDLTGLLPSSFLNSKSNIDVLNGIAFDKAKNKVYVTGKLWPKLFEIELVK